MILGTSNSYWLHGNAIRSKPSLLYLSYLRHLQAVSIIHTRLIVVAHGSPMFSSIADIGNSIPMCCRPSRVHCCCGMVLQLLR
jgi:hypothetical protein